MLYTKCFCKLCTISHLKLSNSYDTIKTRKEKANGKVKKHFEQLGIVYIQFKHGGVIRSRYR